VPEDMTVEATDAKGAEVQFGDTITAIDAVDGPVPFTADPPSGSRFPLGTTIVTVTASDAAGNTATKTFKIKVVDTTGPTIDEKDHYDIVAGGPAGALVTAATLDIKARDKVDGEVPITYTPVLPFTFPLGGPTLLTLKAEDGHHNATEETTRIYVTYAWGRWVQPRQARYRVGRTVKVAFTIAHPGATPRVTTAVARLVVRRPNGVTRVYKRPFTYSASRDQYRFMVGTTYGLKTKGWAKGRYTLTADLGDGVSHTTTFRLR